MRANKLYYYLRLYSYHWDKKRSSPSFFLISLTDNASSFTKGSRKRLMRDLGRIAVVSLWSFTSCTEEEMVQLWPSLPTKAIWARKISLPTSTQERIKKDQTMLRMWSFHNTGLWEVASCLLREYRRPQRHWAHVSSCACAQRPKLCRRVSAAVVPPLEV